MDSATKRKSEPLKRKYCEQCGDMYYGKRTTSKFCSVVCNKRSSRANTKSKVQEEPNTKQEAA